MPIITQENVLPTLLNPEEPIITMLFLNCVTYFATNPNIFLNPEAPILFCQPYRLLLYLVPLLTQENALPTLLNPEESIITMPYLKVTLVTCTSRSR